MGSHGQQCPAQIEMLRPGLMGTTDEFGARYCGEKVLLARNVWDWRCVCGGCLGCERHSPASPSQAAPTALRCALPDLLTCVPRPPFVGQILSDCVRCE